MRLFHVKRAMMVYLEIGYKDLRRASMHKLAVGHGMLAQLISTCCSQRPFIQQTGHERDDSISGFMPQRALLIITWATSCSGTIPFVEETLQCNMTNISPSQVFVNCSQLWLHRLILEQCRRLHTESPHPCQCLSLISIIVRCYLLGIFPAVAVCESSLMNTGIEISCTHLHPVPLMLKVRFALPTCDPHPQFLHSKSKIVGLVLINVLYR